MKVVIGLICMYLLMMFGICSCNSKNKVSEQAILKDNTRYVNTFIGTGGHGHTFPGATVPYGMVQLSPDTRTQGWDACGGYHYTDTSILGFSHTHLSGTGISDLGDVLFMPFSGKAKIQPGSPENPDSGYRSRFSHNEESSSPGYYSVTLKDYDINVELTASARAGFHKYTFNKSGASGIIIDLSHNIYKDRNPYQKFKVLSDTEIVGFKKSSGWAETQSVFFYAKFNKPFTYTCYDNGKPVVAPLVTSNNLKAVLKFNVEAGEQVLAKVGISSVDEEGAKRNLNNEIPDWNFKKTKEEANLLWKNELNKINVAGGTRNQKSVFYTALYHTCISPNIFSDVDGRYRGMDQNIYKTNESNSKNIYTVFSLWDTFRALNPLKTITDPERENEFINTLLSKYKQGGTLPKWELQANYTGCMIGYHGTSVIVDAYNKGIRDYDIDLAYKAIVDASKYDTTNVLFPSKRVQTLLMPEAKYYNATMDYIPSDMENESVSKALEYAYDDWCISQMAKDLGKTEDYKKFFKRSKKYKNYFDSETGYMRGKKKNGQWREPFDPRFSNHRKDDYTEGNAYQWSWFVPHDVDGLVSIMGGKSNFTQKLDELFSTSSELKGTNVSGDISGLIGQYAHGNEPSHHITHLYNFVGEPWKTQKLTDKIMKTLYYNDPNGLAGNEDCGQMSAWYIMNAMGFYSFCPGKPMYSIGRPIFDNVEINLSNGKTFKIIVNNNSLDNKFIQSVKLNGKPLKNPFFTHNDILSGAVLEFEMGPEENKTFFN